MNSDNLLSAEAVQEGFYWKPKDYVSPIKNWDELALSNAAHAVVSAPDEKAEKAKSDITIAFLDPELIPGIILDLGCGYGRVAKHLLPNRQFDGYIGLDSSVIMLRKFHDRYAASQPEQRTPLGLIFSDIDNIPLSDASVDNVIVSAVYLHNHKSVTLKSLEQVHRVLKPGGKLLIISSFPNLLTGDGLLGSLYLALLSLIGKKMKNGPVRYFRENEIRGMLKGYAGLEIRRAGFSFFPKSLIGLPDGVNRVYRKFYDFTQSILKKILPASVQKVFCYHFDVVATK